MLELHVTDADVTGGSVPVAWCLDRDDMKYLNDMGVKRPVVVLVVSSDDHPGSEFRKIVPLKDLMAYIEFRRSGKNSIRGFIFHDKASAESLFLDRYPLGDYAFNILNYEASDYRHGQYRLDVFGEGNWNVCPEKNDKHCILSEPVSVHVPRDVFAPEPSEWEKAWVNHFHRKKPIDQCDFRRRRLFAYTLQPIIMMFDLLFRFLMICLALFVGARNVTAKYLLHPLTYSITDSNDGFSGGTFFVGRGKNVYLNWARLALMPPFLCIYALLWRTKQVGFALSMLAICIGLVLFSAGFVLFTDWDKARRQRIEREADAWYLDEEEMKLILCDGSTKPRKISELPLRHRTLRLRFQTIKAQICRPFSG